MSDKRVFPVIHLVSEIQTLEQAAISFECGASGVFLIDMGGSKIPTDEAYGLLREDYDEYIGINVLGMRRGQALALAEQLEAQGLWLDNAGIDERPETWDLDVRLKDGPVEVFGGVAFKYQRAVSQDQLEMVTTQAARLLDVVCTSGPGTGKAADVVKLATMRAAIDAELEETHTRLAVASGVSPENAETMFEFVDDVLLATGIEERFGFLSAPRLAEVVKIANSF